jgi:stage II sporulation protein GA (sporulation sigma-E factor processing peptidase)
MGETKKTMVVYIDVLFVINLIVNYFILLAVSQILKRNDKRWRLFAGAALGALYASLIFFPKLEILYVALLKLVLSITIVAVSFKIYSIKNFFKLIAVFYIISMLFGGVISALEYFLAPPRLIVQNGIAYLNISPLFLILSSAGCYIVIKLFSRFFHADVHTDDIYEISIEFENKTVTMTALLDNGNDLTDAISGAPVIIAEYSKTEPLIPIKYRDVFKTGQLKRTIQDDTSGFSKRFRLVPYGSVGTAGGLLPAFRPDRVSVKKAGISSADVLVGVTNKKLSDDGVFTALLNPRIFHTEKTQDTEPKLKPKIYS